jgi:hypothetical protein
MTDTAARAYGPAQPGTSNGTLYTVPTDYQFIVRNIHACNTTSSAATLSVGLNGTAATAANCLLSALSIPAYSTYDWSGFLCLEAADTIQSLQGTSGALTVTISGVLVIDD